MRFIVKFDHELGQAKSYRMTAPEALKLATEWGRAGEKGVLVENPDTGEVWTAEAFRVMAG